MSFQSLKPCVPGAQESRPPWPSGQAIKWPPLWGLCAPAPAGVHEAAGECAGRGTLTSFSEVVGKCLDCMHTPASEKQRVDDLSVCAQWLQPGSRGRASDCSCFPAPAGSTAATHAHQLQQGRGIVPQPAAPRGLSKAAGGCHVCVCLPTPAGSRGV